MSRSLISWSRSGTAALLAVALVACAPKTQPASAGSEAPAPVASAEPTPAPGAQPTAPAPAGESSGKSSPQVDKAADLLDQGTAAAARDAIALLEPVVRADPSDNLARYNLGAAYFASGDATAAKQAYEAVLASDPTFGHAYLGLGRLAEAQNRRADADALYRQGIGKDPSDMALRVALVDSLVAQKKYDDAIAEGKAALRENTQAVEVYNAMGLAYLAQQDYVLARFVFQKALVGVTGADSNAYIHCNLGRVFFLLGDTVQATSELEKAAKLDPNLVPALVYLSQIYMADHNYAETIPLLERAAAQDPNNHGVQMNLGVAYRGVGRLADAKAAYAKALTIEPSNPDPHFNLGILVGDYEKNYNGAVDEFKAYIDAGGADKAVALQYIDDVQKEQKRDEKRKKAEEDRKKREEEKKKKDDAQKGSGGGDAPAPAPPAPGSPWGGTGTPAPAPTAPPPPEPAPAPAPQENP